MKDKETVLMRVTKNTPDLVGWHRGQLVDAKRSEDGGYTISPAGRMGPTTIGVPAEYLEVAPEPTAPLPYRGEVSPDGVRHITAELMPGQRATIAELYGPYAPKTVDATMNLMVRACNNHEALVEALRRIAEMRDERGNFADMHREELRAMARAALREIESEARP